MPHFIIIYCVSVSNGDARFRKWASTTDIRTTSCNFLVLVKTQDYPRLVFVYSPRDRCDCFSFTALQIKRTQPSLQDTMLFYIPIYKHFCCTVALQSIVEWCITPSPIYAPSLLKQKVIKVVVLTYASATPNLPIA